MLDSKDVSALIETSGFGIFTKDRFLDSLGDLDIDRVSHHDGENIILYLRVRNNTSKIIKINSFVVSEFNIPLKLNPSKVLEHGWLQCSEVSMKDIRSETVRKDLFLQRDQNPYSFLKEYGYIQGSVVSEWFTSIDFSGDKSLFVGAVTTKDQFSQIFIKFEDDNLRIRVTSQFDGLNLSPGQVAESEKIFFSLGSDKKTKREFAESLAKHMSVDSVRPPIKAMCNSYYWNGNKIDEATINRELEAIEALPHKLNIDYFQLDAGYTDYFGDWTDYKKRFPNGFGQIVAKIKSLGYKAGIWISPFAINPNTKLHDYHKSWLLRGDHKKHFEGRWTSPVDNVVSVMDLEVLDPTMDEVKDYLTGVLTHFKDLGFTLFKIDFLYPVCLSGKYSKQVTRAQALREGMSHIRKVLGKDCMILSGITELSPIVGLVDFVRTGIDTLNPFVCGLPGINSMVNEFMLENNIRETESRLFLNGVVWRADPDVLIFREGTGVSPETILKHKNMAKENSLSLWFGDSVYGMDAKTRQDLVQFFG